MKRLLRSLDAACVAAVVILVGTNAIGASDRQTLMLRALAAIIDIAIWGY